MNSHPHLISNSPYTLTLVAGSGKPAGGFWRKTSLAERPKNLKCLQVRAESIEVWKNEGVANAPREARLEDLFMFFARRVV